MAGRVNHAQRSRFELQLVLIIERAAMVVVERVRVLPHLLVKLTHRLNLVVRDPRALQELQVFFVFEPGSAMTSLPIVHEHLSIVRFIAQ